MEKLNTSFIVMNFILLFALIGFIFVIFDLRGVAFVFELGILFTFLILLTFGMFFLYHEKLGSWGIIGSVLLLLLFDVFIVFLYTRNFSLAYIVTILASLAGLIIAVGNVVMSAPKENNQAVTHEKSKYYYPFIDKMEPKDEVEAEAHVEKEFIPGKFVASKKASKYHSPKCDWALRISKVNQVWFDSKKDAESKGFEPDKCI
jgi:predicted membrane protein